MNKEQKESLLNLIDFKTEKARLDMIEEIEKSDFSWCENCKSYHNCKCVRGTTITQRSNGRHHNGFHIKVLPDDTINIWLYHSTFDRRYEGKKYLSMFKMDINGNLTEVDRFF